MWAIGKDNRVQANPYEMRRLKTRRRLTDRTLFIECPNYPVMDAQSAKLIAVYALSDAAIGGCGKIVVRGPRWHFEFDVAALNGGIKRRWGGRMGILHNPREKQAAGCFFDATRKLWQVPTGYKPREVIKFPATPRAA